MADAGYGQFCPVALSAEILSSRWTIVLLRELIAGSTRFNDLRRGLSRMSPTLLSKRLKELEQYGILERPRRNHAEYRLTEAGRDLKLVVEAFGGWGQRWMSKQLALQNLDPMLLMVDMRRNVDASMMPRKEVLIHISYPEQPKAWRNWWLVVDRGGVEIDQQDPGVEPDLTVTAELKAMTEIWIGASTIEAVVAAGRMKISGDQALASSMEHWLGLSPFTRAEKAGIAPVTPRRKAA
jgi:DNA-binding HxlR family transcriptional regulator